MPKEKKEIPIQCSNCGETVDHIYDETRGEIICGKCSYVIMDSVPDLGPEWTEYNQQGLKRRRTGPPTDDNRSLMTQVGKDFKDVYGNSLKNEMKPLADRMRKAQKQAKAQDPRERNFEKAEQELDSIAMRMGIPDGIKTTFKHLYRKLMKKKYTRGRPIERIVPALLFLCHKLRKIPRSMGEFEEETQIKEKKLWSTYNEIVIILELEDKITVTDYKGYISKFIGELDLPERIFPIAVKIVKEAQENNEKYIADAVKRGEIPPVKFDLVSKDPKGIAAAAIYSACLIECREDEEIYRTQNEIATTAKISEPTLRKRWKALKKNTNYFKEKEEEEENE